MDITLEAAIEIVRKHCHGRFCSDCFIEDFGKCGFHRVIPLYYSKRYCLCRKCKKDLGIALSKISEECLLHSDCMECPLYADSIGCVLLQCFPPDWEVGEDYST